MIILICVLFLSFSCQPQSSFNIQVDQEEFPLNKKYIGEYQYIKNGFCNIFSVKLITDPFNIS